MIPAITLLLLGGFLYFGNAAHWFDIVLYGTRNVEINVTAEIQANVLLAALIAWSIRNDLTNLWHRGGQ